MHELITNLNETQITAIEALKNEVPFVSDDIRIGANGVNNISVYNHSKWTGWNRAQKAIFKDALSEHVNSAVIGWFVTFPVNGHLDKMTYWVDMPSAGTVVAYSLTDNNSIIIEDQIITLNKGEGIKFNLKNIHEIKAASNERSWACLMQLQ